MTTECGHGTIIWNGSVYWLLCTTVRRGNDGLEEGWQSGGCRRLCFGKVDDDELPSVSVVRSERLMLSSALLTTNCLRVWVWCKV